MTETFYAGQYVRVYMSRANPEGQTLQEDDYLRVTYPDGTIALVTSVIAQDVDVRMCEHDRTVWLYKAFCEPIPEEEQDAVRAIMELRNTTQ